MKKNNKDNKEITLNTPSKFIINLYSLLAILIVVIPESIAELMLTLKNKSQNEGLEENNDIWESIPELKLSTMNMKGLREMARNLNIKEYARDNRKILSERLIKKLSRN